MIHKEVLGNGLRVILVPNAGSSVVTAMVMFGVGSRYEPNDLAGISHILEHMNYKGTAKRPTPIDVAKSVESFGGEHNAFTGKEYTGYYVKAAPRHLADALDFLADITLNSKLSSVELEREKGVIIEEVNMYEDAPMELIENKFEQALFGNNALGRDVIGTKETIRAVKAEDLKQYRSDYYAGSNSVVVLAGNFTDQNETELIKLVEKHFSFPKTESVGLKPITLDQAKSQVVIDKKTEQSHLVIGFYGPAFAHPDRYKVKLLSVILGGSMSSRMFTEIRERLGLAYAVRTTTGSYGDTGSIETQVGVPHDKVEKTIEAVLAEYRKIRDRKVSNEELARAKEIVLGRMLISFEDSLEMALHYALGETVAGQTITPKELARLYEKVQVADILETARKYLQDKTMALAYIGPALKEADLEKIYRL